MFHSIRFAAIAAGALMLATGTAHAFSFTVGGVTRDTVLNWPISFPTVSSINVSLNPYGGGIADEAGVVVSTPAVTLANAWDAPDIGANGSFGQASGLVSAVGGFFGGATDGTFGSDVGTVAQSSVDNVTDGGGNAINTGGTAGIFSDWHGIDNISGSVALQITTNIASSRFISRSVGTDGALNTPDDPIWLGARIWADADNNSILEQVGATLLTGPGGTLALDMAQFGPGPTKYFLEVFGKAKLEDAGYNASVIATPIPPAFLLFLSGLVGLVAVGRRKRKALAA